MKYTGECLCGSIRFETKGAPLFTQHCHCEKCRVVAADSANPSDKIGYSYTAAYLTENFLILAGKERLESIVKNNSRLFLCSQCHVLIYGISEDPDKQAGLGVNVNAFKFGGQRPQAFKPIQHIWYQNRVKDVHDGLPKYKDAPEAQGGTGELFLG